MAAKAPRILAEFSDYQGMLAAMRERAAERKLDLSADENAELAGLPQRYLSKLLAPRPPRRIGMMSMGPISGLLGVRYQMIEDLEAIARFGNRVKQHNRSRVHSGAMHHVVTHQFMRKIGALGFAARKKKLSPFRRKKMAQRAARARWANHPG